MMPVFRDPALPREHKAPVILNLDEDGRRYALSVDGLFVFVGSYADCRDRLALRVRPGDRDQQDAALNRLFG